ncbi:hypothetical protein [Evansella halocellulosilytica]|uniref:hypothetical protein n=1 Tax=Evansella halocellulosilytica TaxID=2011013 RepID=UPI000BB996B2|nr:hypothetical protein [Evansella halocellulosilytica]
MNSDELLVYSLKTMMKEAFEGPSEDGSFYITTRPEAGLFGTLNALSANDASQPSKTSDTPIVSHIYHIYYYLMISNSDFTDSPLDYNDKDSWKVRKANEKEWHQIKTDLYHEYETFIENVEQVVEWTDEKANTAQQTLAHTAYHLGALRQMI